MFIATWSIVFVITILSLSWLGMMAVHELGHVTGAVLTGGTVVRVVLHPAAISRTDVSPNLSPLIVAWAGTILGRLIPVLMLLTVRRLFSDVIRKDFSRQTDIILRLC